MEMMYKVEMMPNKMYFTFLYQTQELSVNNSWSRDLTLLQHLTKAVLHTIEVGGPNLLTSNDVQYLTQRIEVDLPALASNHSERADASEAMVSIATNYLKMASVMLEPHVAKQWIGLTDDGVRSLYVT